MNLKMNKFLPVLIWLLFFFSLASCGGGGDDSEGVLDESQADDDATDDDVDIQPDDDVTDDDAADDDLDEVPCENAYCVFEQEDLGAQWECEEAGDCVEDYLAFVDLAPQYADPISEEELEQQLLDIEEERVELVDDIIPEQEFRDLLIEKLNVDFLREKINKRWLLVTLIDFAEDEEYLFRRLLFTDPYVGTWEGILLLPKEVEPFPAVIAIHGHSDSAESYMLNYHGRECPSHGYAILMLTMRAMNCGYSEDLVTRTMLLNGFTFMGLRHYETILALKYLYYLPEIDNDRIGLIGHSGGSVTNNLTIRIESGFQAYVTDEGSHYYNVDDYGYLSDDTTPAVHPYYPVVNGFPTLSVPNLHVPYGYTNGMGEIFDFFDEYLK